MDRGKPPEKRDDIWRALYERFYVSFPLVSAEGSKPGLFHEDGFGWYGIASSNSGLNWFAARNLCRKMKGELITANDADTSKAVISFLKKHGK